MPVNPSNKVWAVGRASDGSDLAVLDNQGNFTIKGVYSPSSGGSSPIQTATVTLSAAQLKNLIAAPPLILAAPGVGKVRLITGGVAQYKAGVTAFTLNGQLEILLGQLNTISVLANGYTIYISPNGGSGWGMDTTVSSGLAIVPAVTQGPSDAIAQWENQPLYATLANFGGSELTNGTGSLVLFLNFEDFTLQ